jgi:hypothetical protein
MNENQYEPDNGMDADVNGHLAMALFAGVILIMLLIIYGLAMAA